MPNEHFREQFMLSVAASTGALYSTLMVYLIAKGVLVEDDLPSIKEVTKSTAASALRLSEPMLPGVTEESRMYLDTVFEGVEENVRMVKMMEAVPGEETLN